MDGKNLFVFDVDETLCSAKIWKWSFVIDGRNIFLLYLRSRTGWNLFQWAIDITGSRLIPYVSFKNSFVFIAMRDLSAARNSEKSCLLKYSLFLLVIFFRIASCAAEEKFQQASGECWFSRKENGWNYKLMQIIIDVW